MLLRNCAIALFLLISPLASAAETDYTQYVNPLIGTAGHGHTNPAATLPFGMVQVGPDTFNEGWDWSSGYHYSDSSIMGFSHTHLSGTGVGDMMDILFMPTTGELRTEPGSREKPGSGYRSQFSHHHEIVQPGYYSVLLSDYAIKIELTATERAAFHKYTFPNSEHSHILIDLAHMNQAEGAKVLEAQLKVVNESLITGFRRVSRWAPDRHIYFAARFSKPFLSSGMVVDRQIRKSAVEAKGRNLICYVDYQTKDNEVVLVKVGISGVSVDGAIKNLEKEIPQWDFERVRRQARDKWNYELAKIQIESVSQKGKETFYTALYHALLAPTLFDDVDNQYRGLDGEVHQTKGFHNYGTFSLWDTYRAVHPLYILIEKERVPDMVNCLLAMAEESPQKIVPIWPLAGNETGCMIGYHAVSVIAEAYQKSLRGFDPERAYQIMKQQALKLDYRGLGDYQHLGYVACDKEPESVSKTIEYSYDDWAIAQVAKALGKEADTRLFLKRAAYYRNLYDRTTRFLRPRMENGKWASPFDPKRTSTSGRWRDFTEANSWQYSWGAQHDPKGIMDLLGGPKAFVEKLDALFSQSSEVKGEVPEDMTGLIGMYAHGNEPSHHIAYLYDYAGAAYKTQERVRQILETMYDNTPEGLPGNEDCGQMSAWYLFSALGFYPVDPAGGNYVMGSPMFPKATVDLGGGRKLVIEASNVSAQSKYIQSVTFNGKPYQMTWFPHEAIQNGAVLEFRMESQPNKDFGSARDTWPPSMSQ